MTAPSFPLDVIHCADARHMDAIPDEAVHLVVTSPPYNVGKPYDGHNDSLPLDEYLEMLNQVWLECYRVLVPGGRLCINVANTDRKPYMPLNALITAELLRMNQERGTKWLMRGEIIWDKGASVGVSTAWGSFGRSSDPVLRDVHEYIMVFSKERFRLPGGRETGITGGEFVSWTRSIWRPEDNLPQLVARFREKIADARRRGKDDRWLAESLARAALQHFTRPSEAVWEMTTESTVDHPAPFPVELPRRLILLYTAPGDVVLDPFMGSGSTAIAAVLTGRHYVGYEISAEYCALARRRLEGITQSEAKR